MAAMLLLPTPPSASSFIHSKTLALVRSYELSISTQSRSLKTQQSRTQVHNT
jgi:hypothetical protein